MFTLLILTTTIFFISFALMSLSLVIFNKMSFNREKSSAFECGFDSNCFTRLPFSLRFFLITIIFLIFDVEVVILLPCIKSVNISDPFIWWGVCWFFIFILMGGLFHEWNEGALNWSI